MYVYDIAVSLFRQKIKIKKNIKKCYTFSFLVFKSALFGVYTRCLFFLLPSWRKAQNYFFIIFGDDVVVVVVGSVGEAVI